MHVYPDCPTIHRRVTVGGTPKFELYDKLQKQSIQMNAYGEILFADDRFEVSEASYSLDTVELTVADLGFPDGAVLSQIYKRAAELGLGLCPLELGPHLRVQYLDQPVDNEEAGRKNRAPSGSITIASKIISEDDEFPKGFYVRNIDGMLWLRGYIADDLHIWNPHDRLIFCGS